MNQAVANLESVPLLQRRIGASLEMDREVDRFPIAARTAAFYSLLIEAVAQHGPTPLTAFGKDSSNYGITPELLHCGRWKREES